MNVVATKEVWRFDVEHGRKFLVQGQRYKTISLLQPTKIENIMKRPGPKSAAQTPAPKSERIRGSKVNPKGSATAKSKSPITLGEMTNMIIKTKVSTHNKAYPSKKVTVETAKKVVRRGMGAYSATHRPTITGGKPNSRTAWGLARLNKFLEKKAGKPVKKAYIQDDDLM
jgi:hypothetical protein